MRRAGWLCAKNYRKHCRMNKPVCIPVVDVREGGPVRHALDARTRARALRDDCVTWLPRPGAHAASRDGCVDAPLASALVFALHRRTRSDRRHAPLSRHMVSQRHVSVGLQHGRPRRGRRALARPHARLAVPWARPPRRDRAHARRGRRIRQRHLARLCGHADRLAPGRFAAAINQAPLWRRTRKPWLRPYDLAANALRTWPIRFRPPDHLLREVFETCRDFDEAKHGSRPCRSRAR